jgi:2-aminobenzoate-CoA ligase
MIDGIGATEMLHIFISAAGDDIRPGATGKPVPGYQRLHPR